MKNKLSLNKQLKEARNYIYESRNHIYLIVLIFFVFAVFGFIFSSHLGFIEDFLKELLGKIKGLNGFEITVFILQNNLQSAFFGMLLGVFFGIYPIIGIIGNGVVLGYVFSLVIAEEG